MPAGSSMQLVHGLEGVGCAGPAQEISHKRPQAAWTRRAAHAAAAAAVSPAGVLGGSKEQQRKFTETVELQIGLKNYDPQKDKRFSGSVKLPYCPRPQMKVRRHARVLHSGRWALPRHGCCAGRSRMPACLQHAAGRRRRGSAADGPPRPARPPAGVRAG